MSIRACRVIYLLIVAAASASTSIFAAPPLKDATVKETQNAAPTQSSLTLNGDRAAGEKIAAQCAGCHGVKGTAPSGNQFPLLDGQTQQYLFKQLHDFVKGTRNNPVMTPIAQQLSEQQMADLAAYYASFKNPRPAAGAIDAAQKKRAEQLLRVGDAKLEVQGCGNCHGINGGGEPPLNPALSGQNQEYLKAQLQAWQQQTRNNDGGRRMGLVATRLPAADIDALSLYFSQLR